MSDPAPAVPACILVSSEAALARHVAGQGLAVLVAADLAAALETARARPDLPVVVDLAAFPGLPKELRRGAVGGERPGAVVGFASPLGASGEAVVATAEAFCDEVVARPRVVRELAGVLRSLAAENPNPNCALFR